MTVKSGTSKTHPLLSKNKRKTCFSRGMMARPTCASRAHRNTRRFSREVLCYTQVLWGCYGVSSGRWLPQRYEVFSGPHLQFRVAWLWRWRYDDLSKRREVPSLNDGAWHPRRLRLPVMIVTNIGTARQLLENLTNIKFCGNPFNCSRIFMGVQTDARTDFSRCCAGM
jgi:hypothetical protein